MNTFLIKLFIIGFVIAPAYNFQLPDVEDISGWSDKLGGNPLPVTDQANAEQIASLAQASEWLGPLAPIAISPFFGITCLAAISQFGGDYLPLNQFLSTNPVLNNPVILWVFLGLTVLTSLPRFTKVSKPVGQAIDLLETYAAIITILVIRFMPDLITPSESMPATAMVIQMGWLTFSTDMILALAAVINIIVINTVKFFFEVLVWLIPFPFVDAALEIANKSLCAGLMSIYAFSPTLATIFNLVLFLTCLVAFRWINRRVGFMRSIITDPVWSLISRNYGVLRTDQLVVFPQTGRLGFAAKSKLILRPVDAGWQLIENRFLFRPNIKTLPRDRVMLTLQEGILINSIEVSGEPAGCLLFSRRYRNQAEALANRLKLARSNSQCVENLKSALATR